MKLARLRPPGGDAAGEPGGDPGSDPVGDPGSDPGSGPVGDRRPRWRQIMAWVTTALACLLVLFALLAPNQLSQLTPAAFLRVPAEGLLAVALLLVLPARGRRVVAVVAGLLFGVLAIMKIVDMGFFAVLAQPFNPVLDWGLLDAAMGFLAETVGQTAATALVAAAAGLAVVLVVLMTLSVLRLARLVVRHRTAAARTVAVLTVGWVACALLGAQVVPGVPVAAHSYGRVLQVSAGLQDRQEFASQSAVDAFGATPGAQLLTDLRGKDVMVTFIESYGRAAVDDPRFARGVGAVLDAGERRLRAAGFSSRSAFLTSPTVGGASWLAHATLLSGLWVENQQRYDSLLASERVTLNRAFHRAGWRVVAVQPGHNRPWPEGEAFFNYDQVYDARNLGYQGPRMNWGVIPDQYALSVFAHAEHARTGRPPVMAEIALLSSHGPWSPVARLSDWAGVGDGSGLAPVAGTEELSEAELQDPDRMRRDYRRAIEYSLNTLISYVETFGDEDLVLLFLGDHQPAPIVTGQDAGEDVPVTIVAGDPAVLDQISGWGWQPGLRPGSQAPVWRMDEFRDRFLTAFGSRSWPTRSSDAPAAAGRS